MTRRRAVVLAARRPAVRRAARGLLERHRRRLGGDQGYVAGKGIITSVDGGRPQGARARSPAPRWTATQVSLADYRGKVVVVNVWGSWCGAVPGRGRRCWPHAAARPARARAWCSSASTAATPAAGNAQAFVRRFEIPYPQHLRPAAAARCWRSAARCPPNSVPEHRGHRRAGPGRRQRDRPDHPHHARRPRRGRAGGGWRVTLLDVGAWFQGTALSGSLVLALPGGRWSPGLVSFFSPCVVPLLPGYLSYATGLSGVDLENARRGRMVLGSFLFVLGFSFVFVAFGALFGALGDWLLAYTPADQRRARLPHDPARRRLRRAWCRGCSATCASTGCPAVGLAAAPLLGVLFGLGWTPCIGPTLSAVQALALQRGHRRARARCSASPTRLGLGCRSSSPGSRSAGCSARCGWVRRHQAWVTRSAA